MGLNQQLHQIAAAKYKIGAGADQVIGSITNSSINTNIEVLREVTAQNIYPTAATTVKVEPVASLTTLQIAGAIDGFGFTGTCLATTDTLELYAQLRQCTGPQTGAVSEKYALLGGIIVPRSLRVNHRGNAEFSVDIYAVTDSSSNAPLVKTGSVAVPTPINEDERWTIGAGSKINNVALTGIQSIEFDFGNEIMQESADSEVYNTFVGIKTTVSKVTVAGLNVDWFDDLGDMLNGEACLHADTYFHLLKRGVALATAEHIKISAAGLAYSPTPLDGQADSPATTTVVVDPVYDGTNAPLIADTTFALA